MHRSVNRAIRLLPDREEIAVGTETKPEIKLGPVDSLRFAEHLLQPPAPVPALVDAVADFRATVKRLGPSRS